MHHPARMAALIETFSGLPAGDLEAIDARLVPVTVRRSETLISAADTVADAMFIVISGRFEVLQAGSGEAIAEIGSGSPIGEIAFFAGGTRTATVRALRDSVVLRLRRADFDELARERPRLWQSASSALARRLATAAIANPRPAMVKARTVCVLQAGRTSAPQAVAAICEQLQRRARTTCIDAARLQSLAGTAEVGEEEAIRILNDTERSCDLVVYRADETLTPWSERAIRQADLILMIGRRVSNAQQGEEGNEDLNTLERYAAAIHGSSKIHLALAHPAGSGIAGTRAWLDKRPFVHLHHHLRQANDADLAQLCRYLTGDARGFVACGGGAFSAAHIGCYQAFLERGVEFDAVGGTSGGAAIAAAVALGLSPDDMERRLHDIFVTRRSMKRWTLPLYSLLDHAELDRALEEHYSSIDIADLPIPYFALSTNLTRGTAHCHRHGPLWQAVRASSSIPALLPPCFTDDGDMLVDGCLIDNVPVAAMHALKLGPNIVIDLQVPETDCERDAAARLPTRWPLLRAAMSVAGRAGLPKLPGPQTVLVRSLLLHGRCNPSRLSADDLLLTPDMPRGISHLDWHRHSELRRHALAFTLAAISEHQRGQHPALTGTAKRAAAPAPVS